ncbi:hypothetical protein [Elizabethkingia miricola]|uniref:hypothetical protein n=1 Tax=Elizabethkingia miricola TaxID=172045 RepID=UPI0021A40B2F|nr:hypothetical protein [Elizabethkingia miricola]
MRGWLSGVFLFGEYIQLLNDPSFSYDRHDLIKNRMEVQVIIRVSRILLNDVFDPDPDDGIAVLSEQHVKIPIEILSVIVADKRNIKGLFFCCCHF